MFTRLDWWVSFSLGGLTVDYAGVMQFKYVNINGDNYKSNIYLLFLHKMRL